MWMRTHKRIHIRFGLGAKFFVSTFEHVKIERHVYVKYIKGCFLFFIKKKNGTNSLHDSFTGSFKRIWIHWIHKKNITIRKKKLTKNSAKNAKFKSC